MPELTDHTGVVYVGLALLAFIGTAWWESRRPLYDSTDALSSRWAGNFGLLVCNQFMGYGLGPLLASIAAWYAATLGSPGLSSLGVALPWQWLAAVLVLDALRWAGHRALHRWPVLWRVHRVHHCDSEFDFSVGLRFHPLENLFMALLSVAAVVLMGFSPLAVLLAEALFIVHNFFSHANASLPVGVEARLRRVLITPDLHRVHHAAAPALANLNFGILFSFWDRLAGTLHALPAQEQRDLHFGVDGIAPQRHRSVISLLRLPLQRLHTPPTGTQDPV